MDNIKEELVEVKKEKEDVMVVDGVLPGSENQDSHTNDLEQIFIPGGTDITQIKEEVCDDCSCVTGNRDEYDPLFVEGENNSRGNRNVNVTEIKCDEEFDHVEESGNLLPTQVTSNTNKTKTNSKTQELKRKHVDSTLEEQGENHRQGKKRGRPKKHTDSHGAKVQGPSEAEVGSQSRTVMDRLRPRTLSRAEDDSVEQVSGNVGHVSLEPQDLDVEAVPTSQVDTESVVLSQSSYISESQAMRPLSEYDYLKGFFEVMVDGRGRDIAKCHQPSCRTVLKMQPNSMYNLKRHYKTHHPSLLNDLMAALDSGSKRGRHVSTKLGTSTSFSEPLFLHSSGLANEMHSAMLQSVRMVFDEVSKRGCSGSREDGFPAESSGRQTSMEEFYPWRDRVTPEVLRETFTRSSMDPEVDDPISQDVFIRPEATGTVEEVGASQPDIVVSSQSQPSQDTQESRDARILEAQREFAYLKKFYTVSVDAKDRVQAKCTQRFCGIVIKMQKQSVYNLKRHYKSKHPCMIMELLATIEGGSRRGKRSSGTSHTSESDRGVFQQEKRQWQSSTEAALEERFSGICHTSESDRGVSPQQKKLRQSSTEAALEQKFNQRKALNLYYRFIIQDMVPGSLTDSERFRDFLKYLSPDFAVPSRRKLSRDLKVMGSKAKSELMHLLSQQKYVATTADSWTAHSRGFLGMTVHWIDRTTIKRQKAVLGCREVTVSQTGEFLARAMCQMHMEFGIQNKVQTTTTDNGANYVAVFDHYSVEAQKQLLDAQGDAAESMVELDQEPEEVPLPDEDGELVDPAAVSVADALDNVNQDPNMMEWLFNQDLELPKHRRCGAHTVNLLATRDTSNVANWTTSPRPAFVKTLAKATAVWTCQNRETVAAYQMRGILKKKLKTPGATCWNSMFDALKCLLEQLEDQQKFMEFNELLQRIPKVSVFVEEDVTIMKEYVTVMEPVAACLDTLQAEEKAYMGVFLPSLFIMKLKLEKLQSDGNLSHAKHLVDALLNHHGRQGFKARFGHLFEDDDLLMATALHPHFKLVAVRNITESKAKTDTIQRRLAEELAQLVAKSGVEESQLEEREAAEEDDPVLEDFCHIQLEEMEASQENDPVLEALRHIELEAMKANQDDDPVREALHHVEVEEMEASQEDVSEKIMNDIQAWNKKRVKNYMEVTRDMFPQDHWEAWRELFIKYNTPLPSSAAVERLFSMASDVLRTKRLYLTDENFDNLIFMKGNMNILEQHIMSPELQEEEK